MPTLQELNGRQIQQALAGAVDGHIPVTVTLNLNQAWHMLHGRLINPDGHFLVLELEQPNALSLPCDLRIGVSFKLKHYKHLCTVTLLARQQLTRGDASVADVLKLSWPARMQRLQRRAYTRVNVPENRIVRAACWLGNARTEPTAGAPTCPVWSGKITNISAGGCQLATDPDASQNLEIGDDMGMRLSFALGEQGVYLDAQVRYIELAQGQSILGFQFMGLDHSAEGRETLSLISARIAEYQHLADLAERQQQQRVTG